MRGPPRRSRDRGAGGFTPRRGGPALFAKGKQSKDKEAAQAKEAELFQHLGRLQMELERLKKNLSCSDARQLRKLVDHDHPEQQRHDGKAVKISIHPRCRLRAGPPAPSKAMVTINQVLASTGGGLDQSAAE
jgi:hypothetical protein